MKISLAEHRCRCDLCHKTRASAWTSALDKRARSHLQYEENISFEKNTAGRYTNLLELYLAKMPSTISRLCIANFCWIAILWLQTCR